MDSAHQMKMTAPPPEPFSPMSSSTGRRICDSMPVMDRMKVSTMPPMRMTESRSTKRVLHHTQAISTSEKHRLDITVPGSFPVTAMTVCCTVDPPPLT